MKTKNIENSHISPTLVFLLGVLGLVSIMALDVHYWKIKIFAEGWPAFSLDYLIRSVIIFISTLVILLSLVGTKKPNLLLNEKSSIPFSLLSIFGVHFASSIFVLILLLDPSSFNELSIEDSPIEWASAIFLFGCCFISAISFLKSYSVINVQKITQLSLAFFSFVFFIMAMEEVSWFQRVLEIETPKAFAGNGQNEMNIHNFATNYIENIYYFGAFGLLVFLPFTRLIFFQYISGNNFLKTLVPRPFIAVIGVIPCAYNFDMWHIIFTQIAFFGSLIILFLYSIFSANRFEKYIVIVSIILIICTQVIFLMNGTNYVRLWEVTEYKEFLIPLGLLIYSLDVLNHINHMNDLSMEN